MKFKKIKYNLIIVLIVNCFLINNLIYSQNISAQLISKEDFGRTVQDLVLNLNKKYNIRIVIEDQNLLKDTINKLQYSDYLMQFLIKKFEKYSVLNVDNKTIVILKKNEIFDLEGFEFYYSNCVDNQFFAKVTNSENGEQIIGANIYCPDLKYHTITDHSGIFRVHSNSKIIRSIISYVGFTKRNIILISSETDGGSITNIPLEINANMFEAITVFANKSDNNIKSQILGVEKLKIEMIKELPTFLGEIDPIKSITALPGVSSIGDISAGFNVRGGENSQNLILQDGCIIFNPTHLFGFFSAFNPDLINEIILIKGGGSAKYGGKVSSILDIQTRNGNLNEYAINGSIGLISSRLSLEGPIIKHKASFLVGGRISYSDWFIHSYKNVQLKNSFANFNDISAKFYFQINDNNFISASGYNSYDNFSFDKDSIYGWKTTNFSLKWDHNFNNKLKGFMLLAKSYYTSNLKYDNEYFGYKYKNSSDIYTLNYRLAFDFNDKLKFEFGLYNNFSKLLPVESYPLSEKSNFIKFELPIQKALENSCAIDVDYDINKYIACSIGFRYSQILRIGPAQSLILSTSQFDGRIPLILDSLDYKTGQFFSPYGGIEPRLSTRFLVNNSTSVKISYNKMRQYIHLISTTTSPSPIDFNIASSPNIKPQISDQYSIGFFKNLKKNSFELSAEVFYKKIDNTIEYIEGIDLNFNPILEAGLIQGKGIAYGSEILLKKKTGRLYGWVAYTYSRSYKYFDGSSSLVKINDGKKFLSVFDQPHQLAVILNIQISPNLTLSSNFVYNSGRPITIPIGKYSYDRFLSIYEYSNRNEYRMPDYHRLDLSIKFKTLKIPGKKFSNEWIFSVFNVYGRKNAFAIFFNQGAQAYKTSIIGSIVPSISYNFNFE